MLCFGLLLVALPGMAADGPGTVIRDEATPAEGSVPVRCDRGETIAKRLERERNERKLTIRFSGTCTEYLVIERDGVEIRGAGPGATLIGGIRLIGSTRTVLENFTIRDNKELGGAIDVISGSSVRIKDVSVFNAADRGIQVLTGTADLENVLVDGVGAVGILFRGGHGTLKGTITTLNSPLEAGLILTGAANVFALPDAVIVSRKNVLGIVVQSNSTFETAGHTTVIANENSFAGLALLTQGVFTFGGPFEAKNNGTFGLLVDEASSFSPFFNLETTTSLMGNGVAGAAVQRASTADISEATVSGNPIGVLVDGSAVRVRNSRLTGNPAADLRLRFGATASGLLTNTIGTVVCDGTQRVRGGITCPAAP